VEPPTAAESDPSVDGRVDIRLNKVDCAAAGLTCSDVAPINETKPSRIDEVRTEECRIAKTTTATRELVLRSCANAAQAVKHLTIS